MKDLDYRILATLHKNNCMDAAAVLEARAETEPFWTAACTCGWCTWLRSPLPVTLHVHLTHRLEFEALRLQSTTNFAAKW